MAEILSSMEAGGSSVDEASVVPYRLDLAKHYARIRQFAQAEKAFMAAGEAKAAIKMYTDAEMWEEAHALAAASMAQDDLTE